MALQPGTMLHSGSYRIIRFIGQGGFGCTYEVEHIAMRRRMAMKEFFIDSMCNRDASGHVSVGTNSQISLVEKLRRKFINEARSVNSLNHPGIVRVTDVFEENGTAYFVMDYIEGQSLQSMLNAYGPMPESQSVAYIQQVCDALEYVHSKHMLHLDVKPANIMIDGDGRAILIDFGVSKQYDEENGQNTSTIVGHSQGFSPLEQVSNKLRNFTPATDIYALGATLYALLAGYAPIDSSELAMGEPLVPLPASVSTAVRNAIDKAMQPRPVNRPQSIAEFRRLLSADPGTTQINHSSLPLDNSQTIPHATVSSTRSWTKNAVVTAVVVIIAALAIVFLSKDHGTSDVKDQIAVTNSVSTDSITALVDEATPNKPMEVTSVSAGIPSQTPIAETPSTPASSQPTENNVASVNNDAANSSSTNVSLTNHTMTQNQQTSTVTILPNGNRRFTVYDISFDMVEVLGGTFTMGATDEQGDNVYGNERPAHQVTLSSYSIGETEVTQELWQAVMDSNPSYFKGNRKPVDNVSLEDCQEFIIKLNQLTGQNFRLPTETEWEFAARGGNRTQNNKYSGSNNISDVAWYGLNSGSRTHEVKGKKPNELGIYDMSGNVGEWCSDKYGNYSSSSQTNPKGPATGLCRVLRGGTWYTPAGSCRVSDRPDNLPSYPDKNFGMRLAL